MESAAFRPATIASMTVLGPLTASPPAKTPFMLVSKVSGSTVSVSPDRASSLILLPEDRNERSGLWPIAAITLSASITNSVPGSGTGRRRPLLSGSRRQVRSTSRFRRPLSFVILEGVATRNSFTPSASVSLTSCSLAGISSRLRR